MERDITSLDGLDSLEHKIRKKNMVLKRIQAQLKIKMIKKKKSFA